MREILQVFEPRITVILPYCWASFFVQIQLCVVVPDEVNDDTEQVFSILSASK